MDRPHANVHEVTRYLKTMSKPSVSNAYYRVRKELAKNSTRSRQIGTSSNRTSIERLDITAGSDPITIGVKSREDGMIATVILSSEGIQVRRANAKKAPERTISWETIHRVMEVGLFS